MSFLLFAIQCTPFFFVWAIRVIKLQTSSSNRPSRMKVSRPRPFVFFLLGEMVMRWWYFTCAVNLKWTFAKKVLYPAKPFFSKRWLYWNQRQGEIIDPDWACLSRKADEPNDRSLRLYFSTALYEYGVQICNRCTSASLKWFTLQLLHTALYTKSLTRFSKLASCSNSNTVELNDTVILCLPTRRQSNEQLIESVDMQRSALAKILTSSVNALWTKFL